MKKNLPAILFTATLTTQTMAEGAYLGISYSDITSDDATTNLPTLNPYSSSAYSIKTGVQFHPRYGWELRLGRFLEEPEQQIAPTLKYQELDYMLGLYNRLSLDFISGIDPFFILGITGIKTLEQHTNNKNIESNVRLDLSYGAGIDIPLIGQTTIGVEYLRLYNRSDLTVQSTSIALNIMF
jgi:opacity protein-like surface antigen